MSEACAILTDRILKQVWTDGTAITKSLVAWKPWDVWVTISSFSQNHLNDHEKLLNEVIAKLKLDHFLMSNASVVHSTVYQLHRIFNMATLTHVRLVRVTQDFNRWLTHRITFSSSFGWLSSLICFYKSFKYHCDSRNDREKKSNWRRIEKSVDYWFLNCWLIGSDVRRALRSPREINWVMQIRRASSWCRI